jgi:putative SOS response-associated peptidase YedK
MCGRFSIMYDPEEMKDMLGLEEVPDELVPNENISPGDGIAVVTDAVKRKVDIFKWGLVPGWAKDISIGNKLINARAETLIEKPSFRNAFNRRRCLIPASGFYEWKQEGSRKQPYLFQLADRKAFTFAGLWEHWEDNQGNELYSCTIITTAPNPMVAEYHDRMPVILDDANRWQWLENRPVLELQKLLGSYPAEKMAVPARMDPMVLRKFVG